MARVKVGELLTKPRKEELEPERDALAAPVPSQSEVTKPQTRVPRFSAAGAPSQRTPAAAEEAAPVAHGSSVRFDDFIRKEARLRPDQISALTERARALNRAKGPAGERITENTLIRVAVDLLLAKGDLLVGRSEVELLRAIEDRASE